jgi:3D (Asp-Asp-Asp) domain-containing protein
MEGARYLVDLIDRVVTRVKVLAPVAISMGCQQETVESPAMAVAPMPKVVAKPPVDAAPEPEPRPLGKFSITFYYVVGEEEVAPKPAVANDNRPADGEVELASVAERSLVTLYARNKDRCEPITEVSREFATQLRIQGTGKLRDGRVVNIWGHCPCEQSPCFKVTAAQWGTAGNGRQLQPFRTVAVDPKVVKLGSLLHVPLLEGKVMPGRSPWGGFVHDGCVVADDVGGGIKGHQLDLFVGRRGWFLGMSGRGGSHAWALGVPVFDGSKICERKGRRVGRKAGAI